MAQAQQSRRQLCVCVGGGGGRRPLPTSSAWRSATVPWGPSFTGQIQARSGCRAIKCNELRGAGSGEQVACRRRKCRRWVGAALAACAPGRCWVRHALARAAECRRGVCHTLAACPPGWRLLLGDRLVGRRKSRGQPRHALLPGCPCSLLPGCRRIVHGLAVGGGLAAEGRCRVGAGLVGWPRSGCRVGLRLVGCRERRGQARQRPPLVPEAGQALCTACRESCCQARQSLAEGL